MILNFLTAIGTHRTLLIQSGVRVETEGLDLCVYTDEKWAAFILGQLLRQRMLYRIDIEFPYSFVRFSFAGKVSVGVSVADLSEAELAKFRRERLGFVFQDFNLLDTLTVEENIEHPAVLEKENPFGVAGAVCIVGDH